MNTSLDFLPMLLPVLLVMGCLVAARWHRDRPIDLVRGLAINAVMSCCFAGPLVRFGADKALMAFLVVFVPTSTFTLGCWAAQRYARSRIPVMEPSHTPTT